MASKCEKLSKRGILSNVFFPFEFKFITYHYIDVFFIEFGKWQTKNEWTVR